MNKYGYFRYSDFAVGAKETASYSLNARLQSGSSLDSLNTGVDAYDYASIEQDAYVTDKPKPFYNTEHGLGLLTAVTSDENGDFTEPLRLTADFPVYYSMTGITIHSRNIIRSMEIIGYRDGELVKRRFYSAVRYEQFYDFAADGVNRIVFVINKINKPYHFFGIYNIEYGRIRMFDDVTQVSASVTNHFSVLGDTLEYDTLDLAVINPEQGDYLFQRKQPIDYIFEDAPQSRFYVNSGDEYENNTIRVLAYDEIANLEGDFLGGMYRAYPLDSMIADIVGNDIAYETVGTADITLTGYLPVSSRRKALQTVLQGSNIRCYKGEKLVFKPLADETNALRLDESNIIEKPQKSKKQEIRSVTVKLHNYSKSGEEAEVYHWYISKTENVLMTFSTPVYDLKAYEVTGTDENGQDIVSSEQSENVTFIEQGANHCIVSNSSDSKIVIKGLKYSDSTVEYKKTNPLLIANEIYEDKSAELTICSNAQAVCELLYELHSRKSSIVFRTLEKLEIGGLYNILGEELNIKSITHTLNGVYEAEAV